MRNILFILSMSLICGCAGPQACGSKIQTQPASVGDEILATDMSFSAVKGEIKYTLPQDALVRLRLGIKDGGPMVRTLLDWQPRKAGAHVETWDLKDASGQVEYTGRTDLMVVLQCLKPQAKRGFHTSPGFTVEFPGAEPMPDGTLKVKNKVAVRLQLDEADKAWLSKTRYEIGFYIDNNFIVEEEEAVNPFTYQFDTTKMNNGRHVITVNVVAYTGEIGTKSIPVLIENEI